MNITLYALQQIMNTLYAQQSQFTGEHASNIEGIIWGQNKNAFNSKCM